MMLSLKGARQISGNNVRMSILTEKENVERSTPNIQVVGISAKIPWRLA
jgi:hypothetical protein